jgi:hypothetical protein
MRPSFRTVLYLFPLALAAGALYQATRGDQAQLDRETFADPWLLLALGQPGAEEVRRANQRAEVRCQVINELLDGHLTLPQTAAQFRDINTEQPENLRNWHPPWYTEEEWPYRQVIDYVYVELAFHRRAPAQAQEWVARLEAELRKHLQTGAAPRLKWIPERAPVPPGDKTGQSDKTVKVWDLTPLDQ